MTIKGPFYLAITVSLLTFTSSHSSYLNAEDAQIYTWHVNNDRNGLNNNEQLLSFSTVHYSTFGKLGFFATDGIVDAEPLHVPGLTIGNQIHNVLYVATEHDTVYAFDAQSGATLWKSSLLKVGESPSDDHGCSQITPEIGVTSTPVIDPSKGPHGAIYVVSMSKDGTGHYHQRISALDLVTGTQLFNGPTEITARYIGTGDNSSSGQVTFDPGQYAERAALLEWNGAIYTSWTSHCDRRPYTGWILGYNATTLQQSAVLDVTPNGNEGSVWMSGAGLAANGLYMYFLDANGTFDTTLDAGGMPIHQDFGNSLIALSQDGSGIRVFDYYATDNTVQQSDADIDLGSGGVLLLPSLTDNAGNLHFLGVGAGKDHNIYLFNRINLGKYHPNGGFIYQVLSNALPNGAFSAPAYFDNKIYYGGVNDTLKAFSISNATLVDTPASRSAATFVYPGSTPSISSNGNANGIVWAISHTTPFILYAFNAEDLSDKYYDSGQAGSRDLFGAAAHFATPTIANGRVYVGTPTGVAVFGILGK
ncbi:hypothetical protein ACPOL_3403 [Acidisarcina polymorpha]|uniref:Pyrrolo-quinoline quinone n=1 Tax=Acidisarcina polymorpha TaxID=2211140 RepID=A0A2Z5G108_9BACT|nr:pyrrolo-quinoline quinone [Acidisarcina polymorpha]AXC12690.1 hypothetical protein ACPOL_3403 [Acidisarcina polymorpha]